MSQHKSQHNLAAIRQDYSHRQLTEESVLPDALDQFQEWLSQALDSEVPEATAMVLSTASASGQPSARVVLLKGVDHGFLFFTNYLSRKGKELAQNPKAALTFFWSQLERQVRIEGVIEKVSDRESDEYFASRPRASQIGALASPQSTPIDHRESLEKTMAELEAKYHDKPHIDRPAHWGGYRLVPQHIEFWQGRQSRLHDRLLYERQNAQWMISRLAP